MRRTWPGGERNAEAVGRRVLQALDAVGPEVVVLALLAVGDHRRAGGFELPHRVLDGGVVQGFEARIGAVAERGNAIYQFWGRGMLPMGSVGIIRFLLSARPTKSPGQSSAAQSC